MVVIICVGFVVATIVQRGKQGVELFQYPSLQWEWTVLVLVALLAFVLIYGISWVLILSAVADKPISFAHSIRLFLIAWPGRYVPAGLPYHGGRLMAAPLLGVSRKRVAASLFYENVLVLSSGGVLAVLGLVVFSRESVGSWVMVVFVGLVAALSLSALQPSILRAALRLLAARFHRVEAAAEYILTYQQIAIVAVLYILAAVLAGLAYYFGLVALGVSVSPILAIGAYNIAGIVGMLVVPIPSGLGVREGVVVGIVGTVASASDALSAAILVRCIGVIADCVPLVAIGLTAIWSRCNSWRLQAANASPRP